jgi:hypothetical protein
MDNLATFTTLFAQKRVLECGWRPERCFKVHPDRGLEFFTPAPPASKSTPDVSKLPLDVQRLIVTFLRTSSAEAIAGGLFQLVGPVLDKTRFECGFLYENRDGWLVYRTVNCYHYRRMGYFFKREDYESFEFTGGGPCTGMTTILAQERSYSFPEMTPRNEAIWLREQLALNDIHPPANTRRKTMWKIFMAL